MTYRCPTCKVADDTQYVICNHPLCPDGRDQKCVYHPPRAEIERSSNFAFNLLITVGAALLVALLVWSQAKAMDHGFDPEAPLTRWMEKQMRPDMAGKYGEYPCCAWSDAYPVDRYERLPDGQYRVWIKDGSAKKFPDGTFREPWDESVPIVVPSNKINPEDDDLDNPSDTSWLFFRPSNFRMVGNIYCFIRHPQGG